MFIPFSFPHIPNVECYFQVRTNIENTSDNISFECGLDNDKVYSARKRLYDRLQIDRYSEVRQVHGKQTVYAPMIYESSSKNEILQEGDGIATDKENLALLIKTADCQPILIAETSGKYIMALHVGWRGNAGHYIHKAILEFCTVYSLAPENLCAVRGPSLSPAMSEFINVPDEFTTDDMKYYNPETKTMDLWKMTTMQLVESGIAQEHIYSIDICTYSSPFLFSYRRNRTTGRQASIIMIRE